MDARIRSLLIMLIATCPVACAMDYAYVPGTERTAPEAGRIAAEYAIPAATPRGYVRVASWGMVDVADMQPPHALRVDLVVTNNSDKEWTLDTREQRLDLDIRGSSAPAAASSCAGSVVPKTIVPPAHRCSVSLFFPLPEDVRDAADLTAFNVIWRVRAGEAVVTEHTPFGRRSLPMPMEQW